jgi:hypothetical protein
MMLLVLLINLQSSCDDDKERYVQKVASVDSVKHVYWGRGLYRLKVHYSFMDKNVRIKGVHSPAYKLEYLYTGSFLPGDTLLMGYNKENPEKSYVIRLLHRAKRNTEN